MEQGSGKRIPISLTVSFFFSVTLFFFGPAHMYLTNIREYSSSFAELCPFFLGLSVSCALLLALLGFLRFSIFETAISLLFCFSFLLWLQGNILVWNYGPLDGRAIDWGTSIRYGLIDTPIWIAVTVLACLRRQQICKIARRASMFFITVQIVAVLLLLSQNPKAETSNRGFVKQNGSIFGFSPNKNVLVLVLDSLESSIFNEMICEEPSYRDFFDGFKYYRNTVGGYPYTMESVPLILTGRFYDNSVPFGEYLQEAFSSDSIPKTLKGNGYCVDLIGGGMFYVDESIASTRAEIGQFVTQDVAMTEALQIFDVTLFRYLPHFLKRYVNNNQAWLFSGLERGLKSGGSPVRFHSDSLKFAKQMIEKMSLTSDIPTFKYFHLMLTHVPIDLNEHLQYERMKQTRENYERQVKGTLQLVNDMFGRLKTLGIYDSTMILVIADHGMRGYAQEHRFGLTKLDRVKGAAHPTFLVKPFGHRGKMEVSAAPASLGDIPNTIFAALKLPTSAPGISVFDLREGDARQRRFFWHTWEGEPGVRGSSTYYLPDFEEYLVSGFPWLDESWHLTRRSSTEYGVRETSSDKTPEL